MKHENSQFRWKFWGLASTGLALVAFAGCTRTTQQDVADAQQAAQEERDDLAEVRTETREAVNEEQLEAERARREARKPVLEEERDVNEARKEGNEAIREEQKDVQAAEENCARNGDEVRGRKGGATHTWPRPKRNWTKPTSGSSSYARTVTRLEGAAKDANDAKIERIEATHDRAEEALSDLKSADVLNWTQSRDIVDRALNELAREMEQAS